MFFYHLWGLLWGDHFKMVAVAFEIQRNAEQIAAMDSR
jgi:hypothetical protein